LPARSKARKPHKTAVEELRAQIVHAQVEHRGSDFPLIIMIAGFDAAGKGEVIQVLNEWLDPRRFDTIAFNTPSDEERERRTERAADSGLAAQAVRRRVRAGKLRGCKEGHHGRARRG
jgi:hypothetical protein